jgi:hypothetical protein
MEEIKFSETTSIWRSYYSFKDREELVKLCEKHCLKYAEENPQTNKTNAYGYLGFSNTIDNELKYDCKNEMDDITCFGINKSIELYKEKFNSDFNTLYSDNWINVVKVVPAQEIYDFNGDLIYHTHKEINKDLGRLEPDFTYVVYIQMPDVVEGDDGVLFFRDQDNVTHKYLPKNGECIIMKGDMEHVPNHALKSTVDRIVMAGNVTLRKNKSNKTIL